MAPSPYISITVRYEPGPQCGTSLGWIAPELRQAGLRLVEDHLDNQRPTRTWSGSVDEGTFRRFAAGWLLSREDEELSGDEAADRNETVAYTRTFDGMNWEIDGISPIISVSVNAVRRIRAAPTDVPNPASDGSRAPATGLRLEE
jgi:hypothetical protein